MANKTQTNIQMQVVRGLEFKDLYSNVSRVSATPFDFSITFGRSLETTSVTPTIEDLVLVRFSPQQLKSLTDGLVRTLAAWERTFGEIKKTVPDHKDELLDQLMNNLRDRITPD